MTQMINAQELLEWLADDEKYVREIANRFEWNDYWHWVPSENWNQCMMCQEVVMREWPEEYLTELCKLAVDIEADIHDPELSYFFLSATKEQRVKAMVRCYE